MLTGRFNNKPLLRKRALENSFLNFITLYHKMKTTSTDRKIHSKVVYFVCTPPMLAM